MQYCVIRLMQANLWLSRRISFFFLQQEYFHWLVGQPRAWSSVIALSYIFVVHCQKDRQCYFDSDCTYLPNEASFSGIASHFTSCFCKVIDCRSSDEVDPALRVARIPSEVSKKNSGAVQFASASESPGDGAPSSRTSLHCLAHTCAKGDDDASPFATCFTFRAICCMLTQCVL